MNNFFTQTVERLTDFWANISGSQRMLVLGLVLAIGGAFVWFMVYINAPVYKVLYTNLGPEDTNKVVKMLQTDNVPYKLENNGTSILVPENTVYDMRIKVAGEGNLVGTGIGYEIFDEVKVGQTEFVQRVNYQRALQGELSRTISEYPNVESARVHLVIPERSLFIEEQQKPSASVVLKLKNNNLEMDDKEVQSIVNMMTMSIEGLDKTRVSISDSAGKSLYHPEDDSLAGMSLTQRDFRLRVENGYERRINELLAPIIGVGKTIAKVNADLDFSQRTTRKEIYDPESSVVRSEQRSEETNSGQANLEAGTPEVNFRGDGLNGSISQQQGARETRTTNYEINKEEHNIVGEVGTVDRLTVAVVVDGTYAKNEAGEWVFTPRSAEELDRIKALVSQAVGFDRARGDEIEVTSMAFGEMELPTEPNLAEIVANYADRLGKPLMNALIAFLFLMLVVRPVVMALIKPKVEAGEIIEGLEGLPSAEEQLALYEAQEEAARRAAEVANEEARSLAFSAQPDDEDEFGMLQRLEDMKAFSLQMAEDNMEQAISVLKGWLRDDGRARV